MSCRSDSPESLASMMWSSMFAGQGTRSGAVSHKVGFPSVEAFGKSNDDFRAKAGVEGSAASTLLTRFYECASVVTRASAVTVK